MSSIPYLKWFVLLLTTFLLTSFSVLVRGQDPYLIGSSQGMLYSDDVSVSSTMGEPFVETLHGEDFIITQGFLQPLINTTLDEEKSVEKNLQLLVHPNPAHLETTVHFSSSSEKNELLVYSSNGELVQKTQLKGRSGRFSLSLRDWSSGLYFIQIIDEQTGHHLFQKRFLKINF